MNRERRKALQTIVDQLETLQMQLEEIQTEEEEYRDNIPKTSRAANGTSVSKKSAKACPMQ